MSTLRQDTSNPSKSRRSANLTSASASQRVKEKSQNLDRQSVDHNHKHASSDRFAEDAGEDNVNVHSDQDNSQEENPTSSHGSFVESMLRDLESLDSQLLSRGGADVMDMNRPGDAVSKGVDPIMRQEICRLEKEEKEEVVRAASKPKSKAMKGERQDVVRMGENGLSHGTTKVHLHRSGSVEIVVPRSSVVSGRYGELDISNARTRRRWKSLSRE